MSKIKKYDIMHPTFFYCLFENFDALGTGKKCYLQNNKIIYSSDDTDEYNFFDFYRDHIQGSGFEKFQEPYLLYTGVGSIPIFDDVEYDYDLIEKLNAVGLHIFLHEMLIFKRGEKKKLVPKPELIKFPDEVSYADADFNFVGDDVYSFELDSIKEFVVKNKLKNVTVYTNEKIYSSYNQKYYPEFKILCCQVWNHQYDIYHASDHVKQIEASSNNITKHFLSLSRRYEIHKSLISAYVLDKNSILSYYQSKREWHNDVILNSYDYLKSECPFNIDKWHETDPQRSKLIKKNCLEIEKKIPLVLDCESNLNMKAWFPSGDGSSLPLPIAAYLETFCHLALESKFAQPFAYFSEKSLNSMIIYRPFILVSTPHSLDLLQKNGFLTFSRWWDESYDQEEDHEKRILKIFDVIDYISSLSIDQLKKIYDEMIPTLNHNCKNFQTMRKTIKFIR